MNQRTLLIIAIVAVVILISCAVCAAVTGFASIWFWNLDSTPSTNQNIETPQVPLEQFECLGVSSGPIDSPQPLQHQQDVQSDSPDETVRTLETTIVPENNPVDLAERFLGVKNVPDTVPAGDPYHLGDHKSFWVTDNDSNVTSQKAATLYYAGDLVYFWVENGVDFDQNDLNQLACTFETHIYPTDRDFFGSEWYPGIDNDPHIYILYTTGMGFDVAGYFSSSDEIPPLAAEYSNAHEMFLLNADNSDLADEYTYGVLAHEFQHMIHWYRDRNETSWINEGMSEVATLLNNYVHTGFIEEYIYAPDMQLNDWPNDESATTPHYGAGMSFLTYFLERFGNEATQALVADPANGMDSVDEVLRGLNISDPLTGKSIGADDVVLDWMVTNLLGASGVADGRYAFNLYPQVFVQASPTEYVDDCGSNVNTRDVHQYGVDYINISCSGQTMLHFEGDTQTTLLPESANAFSGHYAFWSNKGDESDMTLTRAFDFSNLSGPITLNYETWYDIEQDWDYVYLLASTDSGANWEIVTTPSGTDTDPTGNSYGWGYTGVSGGGDPGESIWTEESVDLSQFAGQEVLLRFEYVTDAAVNGEGFMLDDVSIPEAGYSEDFEAGDGGWQAAGFARVENVLPQTFRLALIADGDETTVQIIDVPADNVVDIPLDFSNVDNYTLVVTGTTRFTRQTAAYRFSFQ
jgi:hypothetical protein